MNRKFPRSFFDLNRSIPSISFLFLFFLLASVSLRAQEASKPIEGRWDLTVMVDGKALPSWLEVSHSGLSTLVGRFVAEGGSARPVSKVNYKDGDFSFTIPPQWDPHPKDMTLTGKVEGDKMSGTLDASNGKSYSWSGVRAPSLRRTAEPVWGDPVELFNGKDLQGWHAQGANSQWVVQDGALRNAKSGSNLMSDQKFNDFKLHVEFKYPKGSNSGVYLRGRYELQVMDSKGMEPSKDLLGAVYGFIIPSEMMAKDAGEWQSYDVTLIGRRVTVTLNGKTVITDAEIPGITGGAIDSNEGEPGPIFFQGDHGVVEYRNIVVTPAK